MMKITDFQIRYKGLDTGYWMLYVKKRWLWFSYWERISTATDINYILDVREKLLNLNP
jgi:hypothetical protein